MSLHNRTILVTRRREQSAELVAEVEKRGGRAIVVPVIRILDPSSWEKCDRAIARIGEYDGILFTSANAVDKFLDRSARIGTAPESLRHIALYAVGEKTASALARRGWEAKPVPEVFSAASLAGELSGPELREKKFLFPCSDLARGDLPQILERLGATVDPVTVYLTAPPEQAEVAALAGLIAEGSIDVITFASPSAARHFSRVVPPPALEGGPRHAKIAVIGPTTRDEAQYLGYHVDVIAKKATAEGLAQAIEEYYTGE